jgi:hypothetical protein
VNWEGFTVTDAEEHVKWLDARIRGLEQKIEALKDRRGIIRATIADKVKGKH